MLHLQWQESLPTLNAAKMHDSALNDEQEENIMLEEPLPQLITSHEAMTAIETQIWYLVTIKTDRSIFKKLWT